MDGCGGIKDMVKEYSSAMLPTAMYFYDTGMDSYSSYDFYNDGQVWWFTLSACFIIMPEIIVSAFIAYKIWQESDKKREADANKQDFAILTCVPSGAMTTFFTVLFFMMVPTMLLPFVMLPWLSLKSLGVDKTSEESEVLKRKILLIMIQLKGIEALLQACPQLSLKSYIVIHKLHCLEVYNGTSSMNMTTPAEIIENHQYCKDLWPPPEVELLDVVSPFGSLCSLCFSIACLVIDEHNDDWYRKTIWFIALLGSIGSRMLACDILASWNQYLWLAPPVTACCIVLITKKLRYMLTDKDKNKNFNKMEALYVVLEEALLLSYPSFEGILASASYIGWTVWFYVNGTAMNDGTNISLGMEALSTCIIGQAMSLIVAFIALRIGYETPFAFTKTAERDGSTNRMQETSDRTQGMEHIYQNNGTQWQYQQDARNLGQGYETPITFTKGMEHDDNTNRMHATSDRVQGTEHIYQRNGTQWQYQQDTRNLGQGYETPFAFTKGTEYDGSTNRMQEISDRTQGTEHLYQRNGTSWQYQQDARNLGQGYETPFAFTKGTEHDGSTNRMQETSHWTQGMEHIYQRNGTQWQYQQDARNLEQDSWNGTHTYWNKV